MIHCSLKRPSSSYPDRVVLAGRGQDVLVVRVPVQTVDLGKMCRYILYCRVGFLAERKSRKHTGCNCCLCVKIKGVTHSSVPYSDVSVVTGSQEVLVPSVPFDLRRSSYKTREQLLLVLKDG